MPVSVTLVVLVAAVTHATWNALAHSIKDQLISFGLIGIGGCAVAVPLIVAVAVPRAGSWPFLLASVGIHVFYNLFLMRSFAYGDFGQVYPLARGVSPLVVTAAATIFAAETPALPQVAGVAVISAGMATLVLAGRREATAAGKPSRAALLAALATGLTIAAYTVADGIGVRRSGSPAGYIGWLMLLQGMCVPAWAVTRRWRALREVPRPVLAAGLAAGALSVLAYGLVLWAQTRGALAPIAALRETSVIFGALIATIAFKEPFGRARVAAAALVAAGIVLLNLLPAW